MNTIHNSIERRNFLQFDLLVAAKVGLDKQDKLGLTPLMKCCHDPNKENAREMIRLLLKHGANIKILDNLGMNVLLHAALAKNELVIELLLESDEYDPTFRDVKGNSAMHIASAVGRLECVVLLVEHIKSYKLKVDLRNDAGFTPLLIACCQGNVPVARYLFNQGASLNARDSEHNRTGDQWIRVSRAVPPNVSIFNPDAGDYFPTHEEVAVPEPPEEWYGARVYLFLKDAPELCLQEASDRVLGKAIMNKTAQPNYAKPVVRQKHEKSRILGSYHSSPAAKKISPRQSKSRSSSRIKKTSKPILPNNNTVVPNKSTDSGLGLDLDDTKLLSASPAPMLEERRRPPTSRSEKSPSPRPLSPLKRDIPTPRTPEVPPLSARDNHVSKTIGKPPLSARQYNNTNCRLSLHTRTRSAGTGLTSRHSAPDLQHEYYQTHSNYHGCTCQERVACRSVRPFSSPAWKLKDTWRSPHDMKPVLSIDDMSTLRSANTTTELKESESDPRMKELLDNLVKKFHIKPRPMTVGSGSMRLAHVRRSSEQGVPLERPTSSAS